MPVRFVCLRAALALLGAISAAQAQEAPPPESTGPTGPSPISATNPPHSGSEPEDSESQSEDAASTTTAAPVNSSTVRAEQGDGVRPEARRNENVQVNLVDTNATRENNIRVGATATIIDEFRPERGYFSTEYGNAIRNPIHAQLQRGGGFHGSLFWSHNNSVFSARSFFQVGPVKPTRENQYGIQLGTALWKGSFLSLNLSQTQVRGFVNGNVLIPLLSERTPLTTDPAVRNVVQRLLDAYPNVAPNRPDIASRALNTNSPQSTSMNLASGQLNQRIDGRNSLVLRYSFTGQQIQAFQFVKGQNPDTDNKGHAARITWNRIWSPATLLDVSIGFDRTGILLLPTADAVGPIFVNALQMLGPQSNIPIDRAINQFRYGTSLSQRRGNHSLMLGAVLTRIQYNGYETEGSRPSFQFRDDTFNGVFYNQIENLRRGQPSTYNRTIGDVHRAFRNWEIQVFAGDHWALSNKLTLSYGIRWEPWTKPVDALGLSKLPFDSDWNNVGGHLGFAYRVPKGVLRGAASVLDGQLFPIAYGQDRFNAPYTATVSLNQPDLVDPLKAVSARDLSGFGRATGFRIDPELATPYSYHYNFSWENDIFRGWNLQLGYVGTRTHKLFHTFQLNRAVPSSDPKNFVTATTNARRPDQNFYQIFYTLNASRAYYDAGRATLNAPRWRGATLNASYWFSKSIDLGADYAVTGGGVERWRNAGQTETGVQKDQRGLSTFDQPHAFMLLGNWESGRGRGGWVRHLYRNWSLSSIFLLKSGTPFSVEAGSDSPGVGNGDGTNGDRPNLIDPSMVGKIVGDPDTSQSLLPRSAFRFVNAPSQMAGNLGRNTFRKGKIANLNASVARSWTLAREMSLLLRAEAINLSNTPQFAEPGFFVTSPNFGQITNTLNIGRTFRFTLRLTF